MTGWNMHPFADFSEDCVLREVIVEVDRMPGRNYSRRRPNARMRRMRYIPPGTTGLIMSLGVLRVVLNIAKKRTTQEGPFTFEPQGKPDTFEPRLANYVRAVEFLIGLATGSVILIAGSSLHATGQIPWQFVSPMIALASSVICGLLFMVLMIYRYEEFLHHDNYTRMKYVWNQTLGFSSLFLFCLGYLWFVFAVGIALSK